MNTNDQVPYVLREIPSQLIEPAIQHYYMETMNAIGSGEITPKEGKDRLQTIDSFVSRYCGLHAKLATTNIYYKAIICDDEILQQRTTEIYNKYNPD